MTLLIQRDVLWDIAINIVGLSGVVAYLFHLHRSRLRSPLEHRLLFLFWTLAVLFSARTIFWAMGEAAHLQTIVFIPATILPLAVLLTIEGLLRRHAPLFLKVFSMGGLVFFYGDKPYIWPG